MKIYLVLGSDRYGNHYEEEIVSAFTTRAFARKEAMRLEKEFVWRMYRVVLIKVTQ